MRGAIEFLWGLIPQKDDDPVQMWEWRWKSVVLGLIALGLACYASNLFPMVAPPYAMASVVDAQNAAFQSKLDDTNKKVDGITGQLATVVTQQKISQIRGLNNDLIDARRYQCRIQNSDDKSALPFWNTRIQNLKLAYFTLAGDQWPDMDCKSF